MEDKSIDFLDFLVFLVRRKKLFLLIGLLSFFLAYGSIYFLVPEKFEGSALIMPAEQDQMGGFSSILKTFSNLPLNIGGIKRTNGVELYNTIIFSRNNLERVIKKFELVQEYDQISLGKTIEILKNNIETEETKNDAYIIRVIARSPKKAAEMTNFLVDLLNQTVIDLNIKKSRENRTFLEQRLTEIRLNLSNSEDSLRLFQQKSGIIEAEEQIRSTIENLSKLETELALKKVELDITEKISGKLSPQFINTKVAFDQFENRVNEIRLRGDNSSFIIPLSKIPKDALQYYRHFREVKINTAMLEFVIPLYEQARFEEQKEIPVLQVIDYATPPEQRASPKRILSSLIISLIILLSAILITLVQELVNNSQNPKITFLKQNLFNFSLKKRVNG